MAVSGDTSPQRYSRGMLKLEREESDGVAVTTSETNLLAYFETLGIRNAEVFLVETAGTAVTVKAYSSPDNGTNEVQIGSNQTLGASSTLRFLLDNPGRYTKITGVTASGSATVKIWFTGRD